MSGSHSMGSAVTMNAVGASGVTGEAQFMDQGPQTMVTVNLTAQGSSTHSGHLHTGTCASLGPVVLPLTDITLANGSGTSSTRHSSVRSGCGALPTVETTVCVSIIAPSPT